MSDQCKGSLYMVEQEYKVKDKICRVIHVISIKYKNTFVNWHIRYKIRCIACLKNHTRDMLKQMDRYEI